MNIKTFLNSNGIKSDKIEIKYGFVLNCIKKDTRDDKNHITMNGKGKRLDYTYYEKHTIANGKTRKLLEESVREYVRLSKMSMEDYLKKKLQEIHSSKHKD